MDINIFAKTHTYFDYTLKYSPDYKLLAIIYDTSGNESYQCTFFNCINGKKLGFIPSMTNSYEWSTDNKSFIYVTADSVDLRWDKIRIHEIGEKKKHDQILYVEPNVNCNVFVTKDESNTLLLINSETRTGSSQQFLLANKPYEKLKTIQAFTNDVTFSVQPYGNFIYILTNFKANNFKILKTSLKKPENLSNCQEAFVFDSLIITDNFHICGDYMILEQRERGHQTIKIINLQTKETNMIHFPDEMYRVDLLNIDFNTKTIELNYASPISPQIIINYALKTRKQESFSYKLTDKQLFNPDDYVLRMIHAPANDGSMIPITIFYKKNVTLDGSTPLLIEAYGAYGKKNDLGFNKYLLPLVNRGFIYAFAHVRGGGELGQEWYDKGRRLYKKNATTDLINCSEYLIQKKYTSANKLFVAGGSAGGTVVGGAITLRPDLYRGAFLRAPFLDVITTMADSTLPGVKIEYEEWGNPHFQKDYEAMQSYSPYDNITFKKFPFVLIRSSYNDSRVMYWEQAKYIAKLREHQLDLQNKFFLVTDMNAGHLRTNFSSERAKDYSFMIYLMSLHER